jgi:NADPH:quinone reductase-like Zn-dependent oxidoreductase
MGAEGRTLSPQSEIIPNSGHAGLGYVFKAYALSLVRRQHGSMYLAVPDSQNLALLKDLIEAGKITPVIDKTYPLSETPAAFQYLVKEHARGKVVITVAE